MTRATIAGGAFVFVLILVALVLVVRYTAPAPDVERAAATPPATTAEVHPGFVYGRVTTVDDATYEGRLRWGGNQEAFWGDYFDGAKHKNPWEVHAPRNDSPLEIFGFKIGGGDGPDFGRPFMTRFGDIARIEAHLGSVQVTLKSGTMFELDRFSAGDIDDGVRVWDGRHGVVNLDAREIRTIEFLPTAPLVAAPAGRLHGTVRTRQGDFTGFIQWDRYDCLGADELEGRSGDSERKVRYGTIRSIARRSRDSALVTLVDGGEMVLSDTSEVSHRNRGIYVDDGRYGRVRISWDAFERVEFSAGGSGPAYADFPPGRRLAGSVTTRNGRRLAGRLVYDFDESETTETFDVSYEGVDYNIPFGLISSIVPASRARVILNDGEELQLERNGDFGERNAGMLIFVAGREEAEYVPWADVAQIDLDGPQAESPSRVR